MTRSTLRLRNECCSNDVRKLSVGIRLAFEIFRGVANASFVNELLMSIKR